MNDYDDLEEYSSGNSFRARSNTWPLNKPDFTVPSSGANIDETLPEIELEEDDLFTTNENWSTGVVDHDIMSWDPILNAQNQQQQQQAAANQPSTVHHLHQPLQRQHQPQTQQQQHQISPHPQNQTQAQYQTQQLNPHLPSEPSSHQRQPIILQNHHPQQANHHEHHSHNHHQETQSLHQHHHRQTEPHHHHHHHHHQALQPNDSFLDISESNVMLAPQGAAQIQQSQLQHQTSPQPSHQHVQHQTLNSVHCLDAEDSNDYHLQRLYHLHLDNNPLPQVNDVQQDPFAQTLTSMCIHNSATGLRNDAYNISQDQDHHLQPLSSARYDIDSQVGALDQHNHQHLDQQTHTHEHQLIHQHHQYHEQQLHHQHQPIHHPQVISSSLDNQPDGSHMLSSSLGTSGIGLSVDLEDLDFKHSVDQSGMLQDSPFDDQQPQLQDQQQPSEIHQKSNESVANDTKQSDSTSTCKAVKQNVPRRNAWGNMSYADLISQAINSTSDKRLTLSQIYDWMVQHVPYFKDKGDSNSSAGWKNSVRHNLSLHSRFKRLQNEGTGKSSWWTINPEANVGKCARRRAASMEASKYEKKRGRAKKKAEAIRQGLVSYPSLTNSSLNGSTTALEQLHSHAQPLNQFPQQSDHDAEQIQQSQQLQSQPQLQSPDQFASQQQHQPQPSQQSVHRPQLQIQTLDQYVIDQPSQQQQQHLQQLQQSDARSCVGVFY